jgi:hypothetical protein
MDCRTRKLHEFKVFGQVGQESNLQAAVLKTHSDVSGGVAQCRQMPLCPAFAVVSCRRLSLCVGGHWGRYWGSRCFCGALFPALILRSALITT